MIEVQNEKIFKINLLHQLLLSEFYKKQKINNENSVRLIDNIIPNPFFDLKDLKNERD